jgi:hypothetical protein
MRPAAQNSSGVVVTFCQECGMKKLLVVLALSLTLLTGCLSWGHWGDRDRRDNQRQEQRDDRHNGRH